MERGEGVGRALGPDCAPGEAAVDAAESEKDWPVIPQATDREMQRRMME